MSKGAITAICIAIAAAIGLFAVSTNQKSSPLEDLQSYGVVVLPETRELPKFDLIRADGEAFDKEQLENKWTLAFFGYTKCPDVCPLTIALVSEALLQLEDLVDPSALNSLQPLFVSVDSQRDGHEQVAAFLQEASPHFVGASGSSAEIKALADRVGIFYSMSGKRSKDDADYLIAHRDHIVVIDPNGNHWGYVKSPFQPQLLARTFEVLLELPEDHAELTRNLAQKT